MNTEQIRELVEAGNFLAYNPLGRTPGAVNRWSRAINALETPQADPEADMPEVE